MIDAGVYARRKPSIAIQFEHFRRGHKLVSSLGRVITGSAVNDDDEPPASPNGRESAWCKVHQQSARTVGDTDQRKRPRLRRRAVLRMPSFKQAGLKLPMDAQFCAPVTVRSPIFASLGEILMTRNRAAREDVVHNLAVKICTSDHSSCEHTGYALIPFEIRSADTEDAAAVYCRCAFVNRGADPFRFAVMERPERTVGATIPRRNTRVQVQSDSRCKAQYLIPDDGRAIHAQNVW
jgi:hypothetical protein